jgi:hypothetical protein
MSRTKSYFYASVQLRAQWDGATGNNFARLA